MSIIDDSSKRSDKSGVDIVIREKGQNSDNESTLTVRHADNVLLAQLGYKSQFRREFSVSVLECHSEVLRLMTAMVSSSL